MNAFCNEKCVGIFLMLRDSFFFYINSGMMRLEIFLVLFSHSFFFLFVCLFVSNPWMKKQALQYFLCYNYAFSQFVELVFMFVFGLTSRENK